VILSENRSFGSIRIQQEEHYPGRVVGTGFDNPDLDAIGRAFGFETTRIETPEELAALPAILARPAPQFVIVKTSLAAVLPKVD
jgi:acetolactate synthase I/II/III large subunit